MQFFDSFAQQRRVLEQEIAALKASLVREQERSSQLELQNRLLRESESRAWARPVHPRARRKP